MMHLTTLYSHGLKTVVLHSAAYTEFLESVSDNRFTERNKEWAVPYASNTYNCVK